MFVPYGRIFSLDAYRGLLGVPQCIGAKHSSLSRELEWERLADRDEERPDFNVLTGNDLAIDMVMYGSDYLLGLSTFAPEEFARRDRMWEDGDPGFYELNDTLQYLGHFAFRPPVPAYRHDAAIFHHICGWAAATRHRGRATASRLRSRRPRRHCPAPGALAVRFPEGPLARHNRSPRPPGQARRVDPGRRKVDPNGVLSTRRYPRRQRRRPHCPEPLRRPADGGLGRHDRRPATDLVRRRWSRFAASGCGSSGVRQRPCGATAAPTRTSSFSTRRQSTTSPRYVQCSLPNRLPASSSLTPAAGRPEAFPPRGRPTATRSSTAARAR